MATSNNNIVTKGLSGIIAKQLVFSQRNGKTIVSKAPVFRKRATAAQVAHHTKFSKAAAYAKRALQDTTLKELYQAEAQKREGVSAYNLAVADYLKVPVIESVDTSAYTGVSTGEKIVIAVSDNFKVTAVKVKISAQNQSVVEEGTAQLKEGKWEYSTTVVNGTLSGTKIAITATDRPGNSALKEISL